MGVTKYLLSGMVLQVPAACEVIFWVYEAHWYEGLWIEWSAVICWRGHCMTHVDNCNRWKWTFDRFLKIPQLTTMLTTLEIYRFLRFLKSFHIFSEDMLCLIDSNLGISVENLVPEGPAPRIWWIAPWTIRWNRSSPSRSAWNPHEIDEWNVDGSLECQTWCKMYGHP